MTRQHILTENGSKWAGDIEEKEDRCPACGRLDREYRYKFSSQMANALIILYKHSTRLPTNEQWVHLNSFFDGYPLTKVRHWEYLQYWKLIQSSGERKSDDNPSGAGYYRITMKAVKFLRGEITIPFICHHHRRKVVGFSGKDISINEAYKGAFDFKEFYYEGED